MVNGVYVGVPIQNAYLKVSEEVKVKDVDTLYKLKAVALHLRFKRGGGECLKEPLIFFISYAFQENMCLQFPFISFRPLHVLSMEKGYPKVDGL